MSEYWKSTPKYWCKHCKTFVRDTKLEKQNHEATPKHQGSLQRFLRELHRGHEREERDSQRAKNEVARLNGIAVGFTAGTDGSSGKRSTTAANSDGPRGGPSDRKKQLQQLADMGIAIPEEARREMAMAGDWQTQSIKPVYDELEHLGKEESNDDQKPSVLAIGVRKRKHEEDEEKEEAGAVVVKKGWGSTTRAWNVGDDGDLDALLKTTKTSEKKLQVPSEATPATGPATKSPRDEQPPQEENKFLREQPIKREDSEDTPISTANAGDLLYPTNAFVKSEEDAGQPSVVFKKRKAKATRRDG